MIEIRPVQDRSPALTDRLYAVWEASVKATHTFLSEGEIRTIGRCIPAALQEIPHLVIAVNGERGPVGFMGIDRARLEMLFIAPEERGKGLGKRLVLHAVEKYGVNRVCVNEQNPQALGFYGRMGFRTYRRTERDGQGNPYPLLYMKRPGPADPPGEKSGLPAEGDAP